MNAKLALAAARKFLIHAANEMVEPIPPDVGEKFGAALNATTDLIALVDPVTPVTPVTPVLSCPHDPLRCRGCIENACFN